MASPTRRRGRSARLGPRASPVFMRTGTGGARKLFARASCAKSRCSWESGRGEQREMNVPQDVTEWALHRETLGNLVEGTGYATGLFGKSLLGQAGKYHPAQRGFDEAFVTQGKHVDFVTQPKVDYPQG